MAAKVITGTPGTAWTNGTEQVLWQLVVRFDRSCGVCISQANQIGPWFPVPYHRGCNCRCVAVPPGSTAAPFVDFMERIAELPPAQQSRVMGKAAWQLVEAGVVDFADVVTRSRVRPLKEVVEAKGLTFRQLTKAGVAPATADAALAHAQDPAKLAAKAAGAKTAAELRARGLTGAEIRARVAKELAGRLRGAGPSGPFGVTPPPKPGPRPKPKSVPPIAAAEAYLKADLGVGPEAPPPRPSTGEPILPGRPIAERLAAYADGDRKVEAIRALGRGLPTLGDAKARVGRAEADLYRYESDLPPQHRSRKDVQARLKELAADLGAARAELAKVEALDVRPAVVDILKVARPVNWAEASFMRDAWARAPDPELRRRIEAGKAWLEAITTHRDARRPTQVFYAQVEGRASAGTDGIYLDGKDSAGTAVHELCHVLQSQYQGFSASENLFLQHRVGHVAPVKLAEQFPDCDYDPSEEGRKGDFGLYFGDTNHAYYAGKTSGKEALTMGAQALHDDPVGFATKDPEYAKWIIGVLSGELR